MYSLLLALIYLAFFSLGLPDSLLGAGWPAMYPDIGAPLTYMGIVSMVISAGTVVSSLLSDGMTRRFGTACVTIFSVFLTAVGLFGFSVSTKFWMLLLWSVPYGFGAGAIDAALNNYVALHYTSKHMSWLHCFWGAGAIVSPFIMSYALLHDSWNRGYGEVALIQVVIGVLLLCTLPMWKIHKNPTKVSEEARPIGLVNALRIGGVPFLLLGFFAYCAAEATTMYWASTYLVEVKGLAEERAAAFGSLFYIGLTAGRFLGGFIMDRLGDRKMIRMGTAVLTCGILCLLLAGERETLFLAGFLIIGLGCAPIYPCIIHSTPANFGAENSGAIIGIQMASAYVGTTFVPPLLGLLGRFLGLGILPVYLIVFFALMLTMIEKTFRLTGNRH